MPRRKQSPGEKRYTVRFPPALAEQLEREAARQGIGVAGLIRDLARQYLQDRAAAGAQAPLVAALHAVLPSYIGPLVDAVVATRFDAVIAREMAQAATMAALLSQDGMTPDRARELVTNTLGQAVKVAKRRVREQPDLTDVGGGRAT